MSHIFDTVHPGKPAGRYGAPPSAGKRKVVITLIALLAVVFCAVMGWVWYRTSDQPVRGEVQSFSDVTSQSVTITFNVTMGSDVKGSCILVAYNDERAQVGTKTVTVGPQQEATTTYKAVVATTQLPAAVDIRSCQKAS